MLRTALIYLSLLVISPSLTLSNSESLSLDTLENTDYYGKYDSARSTGNSTYYTYTNAGNTDDSRESTNLNVEGAIGSATTGGTYTQYLGSYARTWLELHNQRRKKYSAMYGYEYIPMMWSRVIARSAQAYADLLATGRCADYHHDPSSPWGENLAYIKGMDSPERVLTMWVEGELLDQNAVLTGRNLHMTQVLWRATHYVGCGTAQNSECYLYVCRYVTPGNCNLDATTWLSDTMRANSPCLPRCPPGEGCFSPADL
jgi:hypothetical protein